MHMAISLNWTSETNTMLKSNFISIYIKHTLA